MCHPPSGRYPPPSTIRLFRKLFEIQTYSLTILLRPVYRMLRNPLGTAFQRFPPPRLVNKNIVPVLCQGRTMLPKGSDWIPSKCVAKKGADRHQIPRGT